MKELGETLSIVVLGLFVIVLVSFGMDLIELGELWISEKLAEMRSK